MSGTDNYYDKNTKAKNKLGKSSWQIINGNWLFRTQNGKFSNMQRLLKLDQRSCDSIGYEFVIENDASKDALEMLIIHS